jgi:hypothetical protein
MTDITARLSHVDQAWTRLRFAGKSLQLVRMSTHLLQSRESNPAGSQGTYTV